MHGSETGLISINSPITVASFPAHSDLLDHFTSLVISTPDSEEKFAKKRATIDEHRPCATWDIEEEEKGQSDADGDKPGLRLPVYDRHQSSIVFDLQGSKLLGLGKHTNAFAVVWLQQLVDHVVSKWVLDL